jgi:hypothetical protein
LTTSPVSQPAIAPEKQDQRGVTDAAVHRQPGRQHHVDHVGERVGDPEGQAQR